MSDTEEPRPPRNIIVSESEKWAERPIKVHLQEQTPTGSTGETIRISEDEAVELIGELAIHLNHLRHARKVTA